MTNADLRPRRRVPLLVVVYAASLALVATTAVALVVDVGNNIAAAAIAASVSADQSVVRGYAARSLTGEDLDPARVTEVRVATITEELAALVDPDGQAILQLKIHAPDGTVVHSNEPTLRGSAGSDDVEEVVESGEPDAEVEEVGQGDSATIGTRATDVVEEYLPIVEDGRVVAVFEVYRNAAPILASIDAARRTVVILIAVAAAALTILLWAIFRAAHVRLARQTRDLVEATRRDALTGALNHGTAVGVLAGWLGQIERRGGLVGVALLDLDNFKALNASHGHDAGDEALQAVAEALSAEVSQATEVGRYGPDEFIIVAPPECAFDLEPAIERVRARLADVALRFTGSEALPITVSAGVCYAPTNGDTAVGLLSVATDALAEAKGSGGDGVVVARRRSEDLDWRSRSTFDVLSGLVVAVDTKDRYTKRHSEDVTRYALFLAEQAGVDAETMRALRTAGLLHDVGKIGVPDTILRKPAPLTREEYDIVKQHVALGDLIVRDLPDIDLVRAGIRHHHERWDGSGYLHQLAADEIPLIARILAIADAFSAMTTTRPYRKALPVSEALQRLEDAAGSQLDPVLVAAFVAAIETSPVAPLPGDDTPAQRLWTPQPSVA